MRELEDAAKLGNGVLVHHWDADGISSGSLIKTFLEERGCRVHNMTVDIGNFFFTDADIQRMKDRAPKFVIISDMCMPRDNVLKMKAAVGVDVLIFDHHFQDPIEEVFHHNPIIRGEKVDGYPSTSWIVTKYLGRETDLLTVLGAAGDHEKKLLKNGTIFPKVQTWLDSVGMDYDELMQVVYLLDSSYKVGDKAGVEDALERVIPLVCDPKALLEVEEWKDNLVKLDKEIKRWLEMERKEDGRITHLVMDTDFAIISTVTRKISWANPDKVAIVTNTRFAAGHQIYIRTDGSIDLTPIMDKARSLGFSAGGKREVLGMVVSRGQEDFIETIYSELKKQGV